MSALPSPPAIYAQINDKHPKLWSQLFALQVSLCREVDQAKSVGELNAKGQMAFDALNALGDSLEVDRLSPDEVEFLNHCLDDVRIVVRSRAELQNLIIEGKIPEDEI